MPIAVIADIIGSRRLPDRGAAQRDLDDAIARVETDRPLAVSRLRATVGDELQGTYRTLEDALCSLLLLRLALPAGLECRFGVGIGAISDVPYDGATLADGPGWWAARDAVNALTAMQQRAAPGARTWIVAAPGEDAGMRSPVEMANAYALSRDQLVTAMSDRARRLTYGRCLGRRQSDLAREEGVTQSAVSQAMSTAGSAALVEGYVALSGGRA
jgi:hypothetical protein